MTQKAQSPVLDTPGLAGGFRYQIHKLMLLRLMETVNTIGRHTSKCELSIRAA